MANGYRHLDVQERAVIETQLGFGMRPGAIATGLLRSRSTITREIKRNGWKASRSQGVGGQACLAGIGLRRLIAVRCGCPGYRAWLASWPPAPRCGPWWRAIFIAA